MCAYPSFLMLSPFLPHSLSRFWDPQSLLGGLPCSFQHLSRVWRGLLQKVHHTPSPFFSILVIPPFVWSAIMTDSEATMAEFYMVGVSNIIPLLLSQFLTIATISLIHMIFSFPSIWALT